MKKAARCLRSVGLFGHEVDDEKKRMPAKPKCFKAGLFSTELWRVLGKADSHLLCLGPVE